MGPFGVVLGPFRAILRPQSKTMGADLRPILPRFLAQSGLKSPKSCAVGLTMDTQCWWGPFGAIWGHLGPFRAIWRPQSKTLGDDLRKILPRFLAQSGLKYPISCTLGLTLNTRCTVGTSGGHLGSFGGHLGPFGGPRARHWEMI